MGSLWFCPRSWQTPLEAFFSIFSAACSWWKSSLVCLVCNSNVGWTRRFTTTFKEEWMKPLSTLGTQRGTYSPPGNLQSICSGSLGSWPHRHRTQNIPSQSREWGCWQGEPQCAPVWQLQSIQICVGAARTEGETQLLNRSASITQVVLSSEMFTCEPLALKQRAVMVWPGPGHLTCLSASFSRLRNRSSRSTQCGRSVWPRSWASSKRCLSSRRVQISSFSCLCRVLDAWRSSSRSREVRAMSSARDDLQDCRGP